MQSNLPIPSPSAIAQMLWLVPVLPLVAAGLSSLMKRGCRKPAASLAIGSMVLSLLISLVALGHVLSGWAAGTPVREVAGFNWFLAGSTPVAIGWVLDPLSAIMISMVCFVGLLIFIFSVGYMEHDENFTRFFCFLALFAGAMLGVVIANSLLLLFMSWEVVGLASYLLIGFWFEKPSAAAAAKKAFLTTRVGDVFFFLGLVWLFDRTGTLLFYNAGHGSMEPSALALLLHQPAALGLTMATAIALLLFAGAVGKSGQLPLHVWLPDAMEGPTPVSALIHAATMVAAGVYLMARVYPLLEAGAPTGGSTLALTVITWVGAATALFAALIAVAQNDIKRILAYSTVSQLGYMMAGLGMGGVAVGFFHLITHAFFKALLFLGAGSVIHGCHEEQDIRKMGGLKSAMPVTFATYGIGMLALSGFPLLFSGFWSKDGILEAATHWSVSRVPFYLLLCGALLTAFYMTRQVSYVFFGSWRGHGHAHESRKVMTVPLMLLAFFAIALGVVGTPAWPFFHALIAGTPAAFSLEAFGEPGLLPLMGASTCVVLLGLGLGWKLYGSKSPASTAPDTLQKALPLPWKWAENRFYVDEFYAATVIAFYGWLGRMADRADRYLWGGIVAAVTGGFKLVAHFNRFFDANLVNGTFDKVSEELSTSGGLLGKMHAGRVQGYLRILALAVVLLGALLIWSSRA